MDASGVPTEQGDERTPNRGDVEIVAKQNARLHIATALARPTF
jgi:hypothetical protein